MGIREKEMVIEEIVVDEVKKEEFKWNLSVENIKSKIIEVMDENRNGEIDIEDIIIKGFKTPGIRVNREVFLRKELKRHCDDETIDMAILNNPMKVKISNEIIDKIADEVINYERIGVTGISAALGAPGGLAMIATIPADIIQYYAYMLRVSQKLLYLYGFPEIASSEEGVEIDSETMNILVLCLGVMYGVAGAKNALLAVSKALGAGVSKQLIKAPLTKGVVYPVIKKTLSKWFSTNINKKIYSSFFKNLIPIVGAAIGGVVTFVSFKECCNKLQESLKNTILSNPCYKEVEDFIEVVEETE